MATCEECLHYPICEIMSDQYGISKVYPSQCGYFQNSADVAKKTEVAREIFAEIEREFCGAYWYKGYTIERYIAELKKKYTEDRHDSD